MHNHKAAKLQWKVYQWLFKRQESIFLSTFLTALAVAQLIKIQPLYLKERYTMFV